MNMQELLARKKAEMASKKASSIRPIKPENGKHMYRILPSWRKPKEGEPQDPTFWHDFGQHFVKAEKGGKPVAFVCMDKTFGQPCDVCMAVGAAISSSHDDETIKLLKEANAAQKFLFNVLHLSSTDTAKRNVPQVLEVGSTAFNAILDIMEDYGDITSLEEGLDLIIKKEGTGFDTTYGVLPSPKGKRKIDASIMEQVVDLDSYVAQANETRKAQALANLSTAAGLLPAPASSSAPARAAASLGSTADDAEFEDMPDFEAELAAADAPFDVEETKPSKPKAAPMTDDLDDLDSLLAELG